MEDLEEDVQSGKYRIPAFVRLTFRWEEEDLERIISLPIEKHTPSGLEEEPQ